MTDGTDETVRGACYGCGRPHDIPADGSGRPLIKTSRCPDCVERELHRMGSDK